MNRIAKIATGAAAAALIAVPTVAPAQSRHHDGIDTGDVITGVAVIGGIAAIAAALNNDGSRYGYGYRSRYRGGYTAAVNACSYQAERAGRGRVRITDVDRRGNDRYRVRGVIEGSYGGYGRDGGYDRYDRYGNDGRYDRDDRYGRYDGHDRYGRGAAFTCTARGSGRVTDFRLAGGHRW
jgi:hypothetical protein